MRAQEALIPCEPEQLEEVRRASRGRRQQLQRVCEGSQTAVERVESVEEQTLLLMLADVHKVRNFMQMRYLPAPGRHAHQRIRHPRVPALPTE